MAIERPLWSLPRPRADSPLRFEGRPIRCIATDIDGTLTDMARRLDWDAVMALRAVEALGVPVILATGNIVPATKTFQHAIGCTGPIICENGGVIYYETPSLEHSGIDIHYDVVHARTDPDKVVEAIIADGHEPRFISSNPWRESEAALEVDSIDPAIVQAKIEELGLDHLYTVSTGFACHILEKGTNKSEGIRKALDLINKHDHRFNPDHPSAAGPGEPISEDEVLCMGDSMNDFEMMREVGTSAVVANGPPDLKEIADIVSSEEHGLGVRLILESLGLEIDEERFR